MLLIAKRALCVALAFTNVIDGRAVAPRAHPCFGGNCEIEELSGRTDISRSLGGFDVFWTDKRSLPHVAAADLGHLNAPRAVPIIKPEPAPSPHDDPEPLIPGKGDPSTDPAIGLESDADKEEAEIAAQLCSRNVFGSVRRSACHPGTSGDGTADGGGFGEDPAHENPAAEGSVPDEPIAEGDVTPEPEIDFFELVRGPAPPVNTAKEFFERQIAQSLPDTPIRSVADFDKLYNIRPLSLNKVDGSGGRGRFTELLREANIEFDSAGKSFAVSSLTPPERYFFHESTWSNDGRVAFADYSERMYDMTDPADRLPWFAVAMHIRTQRLPGSPDPKELRALCRVNIVNKSTKMTINSIFETLNPTNERDFVTISADAAPGTDEAAAFDAFMLTDNGRGAYWLLGNYREQFGDKKITQIMLRKATAKRDASALIVFSET